MAIFVLLIFDCVIWCRRKQYLIAVSVIDAAADFYASTKRLMFVSLFYGILTLLLQAAFIAGAVCVYTANPTAVSVVQN
jgi:hypothetical protein